MSVAKRVGGSVVVVSLGAWLVLAVLYAAHLIARHALGDLGCEDPTGSSNYGTATWQWWTPGTRCSYNAADLSYLQPGLLVTHHVDAPGLWSGLVVAFLVVWPIATASPLFARRGRNRQQPNSA